MANKKRTKTEGKHKTSRSATVTT